MEICKSYYSDIYVNVGSVFQKYLQNASDNLIQKAQDDIRLNLFLNTDLKNEQNLNKILKKFGRFPAINELRIVPMVDMPKFVDWNVISPSKLYEEFNSENSRGLVCVYFLAALNIHLGGEKIISKKCKKMQWVNFTIIYQCKH